MSYALADVPVTVGEFEAFLERQPPDTRWELLEGHILAMTNPSEDHGLIATGLGSALWEIARKQGCRTVVGGLRVQSSGEAAQITATIPDVVVRCGERAGRNWVDDPLIVVEVLSPSTMDFDRGPKLEFYKALPSLRDIVLVYQDQVRVEHYRRDGEGWAMHPLTKAEETLTLDSLPCSIGLGVIYAETALADD